MDHCQHALSTAFTEIATCTVNGSLLCVKNTFIDVQEPEWTYTVHRRSKSAPPPMVARPDSGDSSLPQVFLRMVEAEQEDTAESAQTYGIANFCAGLALKSDDDALSNASTGTGNVQSVDSLSACAACADDGFQDTAVDKTTVILRNLPEDFTREALVELLNAEGFCGRYDYIYLPLHFALRTCFGYAFINLVNCFEAERFRYHFEGFNRWLQPDKKVAAVGWSDSLQGLDEQVARFRNSRIMHESMPDELKPAVFENGIRVSFPPPTKSLLPPRSRQVQKKGRAARATRP